ncbi:small ribosomal subunit protein mS39 [Culicoides brevitarsis]|uniref:small ribosomal subunit protein mS39 n=1 Tax=Culicoides brevitarsis TaxID=469753 RepID=UPI00307C9211
MNNFLNLRQVQRLPRGVVAKISHNIRAFSAQASAEEEIVVPKRIHRGPTDILKALAATVGRDPTAAHYKYHDDPFLIPGSNIGKRSFAMAQESGRKAARWIRQTDRQWFNHIVADPPVEAFLPQIVYDENSQVTEENLKQTIENVQVADAILVYNLLEKNKIELSEKTKMDFLQLICFFNAEDTLDEEWLEERWFRQGMQSQDRRRRTWKDGDLAENIFNSLETKTSEAYCAIIRGMTKFYQTQKAFALYQEALEKNIELDTTTYNYLIGISSLMKESPELQLDMCMEFLKTMKQQNVAPNLGTLNAVLQICSSLKNSKIAQQSALRTLAEFKNIGIEPSLASWYYVLITFCKERGPVSHVLVDILNEISGKSFEIRDQKDIFFFVTAMDICRNHLNDKDIAKRVDKLLHTANNYNLIGDAYKESVYYRNYVGLMADTEPIEDFMETYNRLVPNIYTPEPGIMQEVLKAVERAAAIEHIPLLWSHMVIFDYASRDQMVSKLVQIMVDNAPHPEVLHHANLPEQFNRVASEIWEKLIDLSEKRPDHFRWSGPVLGDLLFLFCRGKNFENAEKVFKKINKCENEMIGEPRPDALESFGNYCIAEKQPSLAISVLQFCVENGYPEGKKLAENLTKNLTLDEMQGIKVRSLLGQSVPQ